MSFFNLSTGENLQQNQTTSFELGGGEIVPIPNNTTCIAAIEEVKWDSYEADSFISVKWRITQPNEYANRVIFQKIKVYGFVADKDPQATADKAKRMLAAIDANCGGKLMQLQGVPTDADLMGALAGKMLAIKLQVWKMTNNGEEKSGNWVSAVAPAKGAPAPSPAAQPQVQQGAPVAAPPAFSPSDDDIPF
jgi:hypothetical protein